MSGPGARACAKITAREERRQAEGRLPYLVFLADEKTIDGSLFCVLVLLFRAFPTGSEIFLICFFASSSTKGHRKYPPFT